ncbi:tumor suppressor candidate 2-like [Clavelina lepadiformis]|uniref:tumor suppressor candidate 2-like n=1 Tax=Clavelina lepadiformis TaxID=159417 RepID=UPI004042C3A4
MGSQTGKLLKKGVDYFTGTSNDNAEGSGSIDKQSALAAFKGAPFVYTHSSSLYFDEDGHLAHEFYRETVVKGTNGKVKFKRITKGLKKQGEVKLNIPRLNVDFPVVMYEG